MDFFNSITKSGQTTANFFLSSSVGKLNLVLLIHAASGEKTAPSRSVKPVEESNTLPALDFLFQTYTAELIPEL